ncbi:MAG: LPS export ABC transporter permease LptF [Rhodospirillaceae bacterium]|nr:LPS export ABC transporter permease LptF [Rhodospirillaceae bacterium]
MNAFTRYVFGQLFVGMIFVTAGLTCIIWLSQSLRLVELIVNRGVSAGTFIYLTMLMLPNFLTVILPIALFCVVVFIYAKLITDRELIVMRASGVSQSALAKPALILALLTVALGYFLNLYLLPKTYQKFREMQWDIRYNYSHVLLKEGAFNTLSNGRTVYVRERSSDGQLLGILYHDGRDPLKPFTIMASRGALVESDQGTRVVMFDGNRQTVDSKTNKLSILYFDRHILDLGKNSGTGAVRYREPRERTLDELLFVETAEDVPVNDFGKFIIEGHKRLVSPLSSLAFTLIALACLISGSFSRRSQTKKILLSIFLMVALLVSALGLENVAAKNLKLTPTMYLHALVPIVVAFFMMAWSPRLSIRKRFKLSS